MVAGPAFPPNPRGAMLLQALGLEAHDHGGHAHGRGHRRHGRPCPCWDMAYDIYHAMSTFDDIHMEGYTHQE